MLPKKSTLSALCANGLNPSFSSTSRVRAHHHEASRDANDADHVWWPTRPNPTPYDIFGQASGTPYNKARYIQLVKLYHPDRHHHHNHHHHVGPNRLSLATQLERYRLVSAANDILSDPVRRRMYDISGAGWAAEGNNHYDDTAAAGYGRRRGGDASMHTSWWYEPGNASQNATWEDWERWRQQRQRGGDTHEEKQSPVYMSNAGFAMFVSLVVVAAAWGQAMRAGTHTMALVDRRDEKHEQVRRALQSRLNEQEALSRQGRVDSFVTKRLVVLDGHWHSVPGCSSRAREDHGGTREREQPSVGVE